MLADDGSASVRVDPATERRYTGVGRCSCVFWFAFAHDILGVVIIMVGVFGWFSFHDLLIYAGAIVIFLSLIWWVLWYTLNIEVSPLELEDDVGLKKPRDPGLSRLVRNVSERLSSRIRESFRRSGRMGRGTSTGRRNAGSSSADVTLSTLASSPGGPASAV